MKKRRFYEVLIIFIVLAFNSCGENTDKEKTELNSDNKTNKISSRNNDQHNEIDNKLKNGIIKENITALNDYAYELEKRGELKKSKYLLEKILEKFPDRDVANLNYADVLWKLKEKEKSEKYYNNYIKLLIKGNKIKKLLSNNKEIYFSNTVKLKKVISGYVNSDKNEDYLIEYSNITDDRFDIANGGSGKDIEFTDREYKKGKNTKCLKFLVSVGNDYKIFDNCKVIIPLTLRGYGGRAGSQVYYEIKNNKYIIFDRNMDSNQSFSDYYIEIIYDKNNLIVSQIKSKSYEKVTDTNGNNNIVEREENIHRVNKKIEIFDISKEGF